jgi:hypothetical protein
VIGVINRLFLFCKEIHQITLFENIRVSKPSSTVSLASGTKFGLLEVWIRITWITVERLIDNFNYLIGKRLYHYQFEPSLLILPKDNHCKSFKTS